MIIMSIIYAILSITYALVAIVAFFAYRREPLRTRLALAIVAPVLLAVAGVMWCVSRLEKLG